MKTVIEIINANAEEIREDILKISCPATGDSLRDVLSYWLNNQDKDEYMCLDAAINDLRDIAKIFGIDN